MSAEDISNGAAAAQQQDQQQQLLDDAGIPQIPGGPGGEDGGPHGGASGAQEGGPSQGAAGSGYGDPTGYQQQQQQGEAGGHGGMTEEERTARKIFVGGLNRNSTAFGPVHHTEVLFDKLTGRSRGFGFVTFEQVETINNVVDRHHTIDESQHASGSSSSSSRSNQGGSNKAETAKRHTKAESVPTAAATAAAAVSLTAAQKQQQQHPQQHCGSTTVFWFSDRQCSSSSNSQKENGSSNTAAAFRKQSSSSSSKRDREFNENSGRVFIGGLGDEVTDDVLKEFFSRFGELTSANVMVDRETNRPRGFGFVIYKNPDDAEKALGIHKDLGPNAEAKRAQPRSQGQRMRIGMGMGMGMGMAAPYRVEDPRFAMARGVRGYDHMGGYGGSAGAPTQMYGGYNYAYNPYYAAYYAQVAAAYGGSGGYGGGYGQSPTDGAGADRGGARMPSNRSTPY
ncbi:hypothetical protein Emag_004132 [Eimeria magna]